MGDPYLEEEPVSAEDLGWNDDRLFGPEIRRLFRRVIEDRFRDRPMPPGFDVLANPVYGPFRDERDFLGFFYNGILHQETYDSGTAGNTLLLATLATDDRVPVSCREDLVGFLFGIAVLADKHEAESWPNGWPHRDRASEEAAKAAVGGHVPSLLNRWPVEGDAVRLYLAALAVTFPTPRTHAALTARLAGFLDRFAEDTPTGRLVRFILTMSTGSEGTIRAAVEASTASGWPASRPDAPLSLRTAHLLHAMLERVRFERWKSTR